MAERPLGITIICVIGFIGAIFGLVAGVSMLGLVGTTLGAFGTETGLPVTFLGILGGVALIISLINFVVLYWVWKMKRIGWLAAMILYIISMVLSLVQMNFMNMVIPAIIIIYLWMKKDLFK